VTQRVTALAAIAANYSPAVILRINSVMPVTGTAQNVTLRSKTTRTGGTLSEQTQFRQHFNGTGHVRRISIDKTGNGLHIGRPQATTVSRRGRCVSMGLHCRRPSKRNWRILLNQHGGRFSFGQVSGITLQDAVGNTVTALPDRDTCDPKQRRPGEPERNNHSCGQHGNRTGTFSGLSSIGSELPTR